MTKLRPVHLALVVVFVCVGFVLRWYSALGPLWFDEIWSLNTALSLQAWHEVFWNAAVDNNHPLNTLWLFAVGEGATPLAYRFLSVICGTLTIIVSGWIAYDMGNNMRRDNAATRVLVATLLSATLYPLVHYGSEARGYAPMMLFALLAFAATEHAKVNLTRARWAYGIAATLGLVSHLAILPILFVLSLAHFIRFGFASTLRLNGPFLAGLLGLLSIVAYGYVIHGNLPQMGGSTGTCSPSGCTLDALQQISQFTFGLNSVWIYTVILGSALAWAWRKGSERSVVFSLMFLGLPLLFYILNQPALPHGRYFLGIFVFIPLIIGEVVGAMPKPVRWFCVIPIAALVMINGLFIQQLGRGDAQAALNSIEPAPEVSIEVSIGTEMTYQLRTVMEHVRPHDMAITYVKYADIPQQKPKWLISVTVPRHKIPQITCRRDLKYVLHSVHEHEGMSGMTFGVFKLSPDPAPPPASAECKWLTDL